jgi:prepilin peptidase CpaA
MDRAPLLLTLLLGALLLAVAWGDLRHRIIPNQLNLLIAALAPCAWLLADLPVWPGMMVQIGVALLLFLLFAGFFALGAMGGGDVKLIGALALWLPLPAIPQMLLVMALAGGVLTLLVLIWHRVRRSAGSIEIPYGVAIVFAALPIITNHILTNATY